MFVRKVVSGLILFVCLFNLSFAHGSPVELDAERANKPRFERDHHYRVIDAQVLQSPVIKELQSQTKSGDLQIIEFFSYGCHWCNSIEPQLHQWEQQIPDFVELQRLPVVFHPVWRLYGKAYYTAKNMDVLDRIHPKIFKAVHSSKEGLKTEQSLKELFAREGVNPDSFTSTFGSFHTTRQLKWAQLIAKAYHIRSVPTFIVNGPSESYLITSSTAGGEKEVFEVLDYLIEQLHPKPHEGKANK